MAEMPTIAVASSSAGHVRMFTRMNGRNQSAVLEESVRAGERVRVWEWSVDACRQCDGAGSVMVLGVEGVLVSPRDALFRLGRAVFAGVVANAGGSRVDDDTADEHRRPKSYDSVDSSNPWVAKPISMNYLRHQRGVRPCLGGNVIHLTISRTR